MAQREHVSELMTRCFNCSVLNFFSDFRAEIILRSVQLSEVRVVTSITLNTDSPALLGHAENKRPSLFRVEVCICKHEQALARSNLDILPQVLKELPCVVLLYLGIVPYS